MNRREDSTAATKRVSKQQNLFNDVLEPLFYNTHSYQTHSSGRMSQTDLKTLNIFVDEPGKIDVRALSREW